MAITFINIIEPQTVHIDRKTGGKHYRAKLSAFVNSSNLGVNSDRGEDHGWRLDPEQAATLLAWKNNPSKVAAVSEYTKVPADSLGDGEFLDYLLYTQELEEGTDQANAKSREAAEEEYRAKVKAAAEKPAPKEK